MCWRVACGVWHVASGVGRGACGVGCGVWGVGRVASGVGRGAWGVGRVVICVHLPFMLFSVMWFENRYTHKHKKGMLRLCS